MTAGNVQAVETEEGSRRLEWFYAGSLATAVFSGVVKATPIFSWLPFDLLIFGLSLTALSVIHALAARPGTEPPYLPGVVWVLVVSFVPGVLLCSWEGYATTKVILLSTVTLGLVLAALVLLREARVRRRWIQAQMIVAGLCVFSAIVFRDGVELESQGRVAVTGGTTITTSSAIGAGVLILLVLTLSGLHGRSRVASVSGVIVGFIFMVSIGSRGPVLAVGVAFALVVLLGRRLARRRVFAGMLVVAFGFLAVSYIESSSSLAARRLAETIQSGGKDDGRQYLFGKAWQSILESPWGIGWGDFAQLDGIQHLNSGSGQLYPHNVLLEIACEAGLVGLLGFVLFAGASLRCLIKGSSSTLGLTLLALAAYWFVAAQTSSDINGDRAMWVSLASGLASSQFLAQRKTTVGRGP